MREAAAETKGPSSVVDDVDRMLAPYRFRVCGDADAAHRAFAVRRAVYEGGCSYTVRTPDDYDAYSWFLMAEEAATGRVVGTMRLTPRSHGTLELEQYFRLPRVLQSPRAVELSRFAILPEYRQTSTSPAVSIGLFNLVKQFLGGIDMEYMLLCTKAKRAHTYHWLRFTCTGLETQYEGLGEEKHELMFMNLRKAHVALDGHPLEVVLNGHPFDSIEVPDTLPPLGLGVEVPRLAAEL
jgi:hypothetical protein